MAQLLSQPLQCEKSKADGIRSLQWLLLAIYTVDPI